MGGPVSTPILLRHHSLLKLAAGPFDHAAMNSAQ